MSQPFDLPPQRRTMSPGAILGIIAGVLVTLMVLCVGAFIGISAITGYVPPFAKALSPPKFTESDWGKRTEDEISLEAPCTFGPGPNVSSELTPEVKMLVNSMKTYQGLGMPESFAIALSRVIYKPHIQANLRGAVHGTVTEAASRLGDFNPNYEQKSITISGIPASLSTYKRTVDGQTMYLDTVTVCKENRLWQIQVVYLHAESKENAMRILDSVEIDY